MWRPPFPITSASSPSKSKLVDTFGRSISPSCATSVLTNLVKMFGSFGASVPCSAAWDL